MKTKYVDVFDIDIQKIKNKSGKDAGKKMCGNSIFQDPNFRGFNSCDSILDYSKL